MEEPRHEVRVVDVEPLAVSVPRAGELLGIGRSLAWDLARSGELPTVTLGRRKVVPLDRLRRMVEDRTA